MTATDPVALVLAGGGARAAYQVGVLQALRDVLGSGSRNPFPVICGTSAGAINAAALAQHADDFSHGIEKLSQVWRQFRAHDVYRTDWRGAGKCSARWLAHFLFGRFLSPKPVSLLDNAPLAALLFKMIDFERIARNLEAGMLQAIAVTASGYGSGESLTFFSATEGHGGWRRARRIGAPAPLTVQHLMASSAIPFLFPAVKINREYFGDGSMRQLAPLSPALHLGARRIVVVGTGRFGHRLEDRVRVQTYPSLAQISGHALSSIFLDSLEADLEIIQRVNELVSLIPHEVRQENNLRLHEIKMLMIYPSERLDLIAAKHVHELPRFIRFLLGTIGATRKSGATLASYLLFESGFCNALIELGYRDTMAREADVREFFA